MPSSKGGDENVRAILEQLPDIEFETSADVSKAIGELTKALGLRVDAIALMQLRQQFASTL